MLAGLRERYRARVTIALDLYPENRLDGALVVDGELRKEIGFYLLKRSRRIGREKEVVHMDRQEDIHVRGVLVGRIWGSLSNGHEAHRQPLGSPTHGAARR